MELRVNTAAVLRMLGARGITESERLADTVTEMIGHLRDKVTPAGMFRIFAFERSHVGVHLSGCSLVLRGNSICEHLEGCDRAALLAVTMGLPADQLLRRLEVGELARAVVANACLNDAIENAADDVCATLSRAAAETGRLLTTRFSPGYGDLSLSHQPELLAVLDAHRRLGLCLTESNMLVPLKSITAIVGLRRAE